MRVKKFSCCNPVAVGHVGRTWAPQARARLSWVAPVEQKTHIADIVAILALIANFCCKLAQNKYVVYKV